MTDTQAGSAWRNPEFKWVKPGSEAHPSPNLKDCASHSYIRQASILAVTSEFTRLFLLKTSSLGRPHFAALLDFFSLIIRRDFQILDFLATPELVCDSYSLPPQ